MGGGPPMKIKKIGFYKISVLFFCLIAPAAGTVIEALASASAAGVFQILFQWFVFSGVGLRLLSSGVRQVVSPSFTAREIFKLTDSKDFVIVRELGFANLCFGVSGVLSFFFAGFRLVSAISGGLYLASTGFAHLFRKRDSENETLAMASDLFVAAVLFTLGLICYL